MKKTIETETKKAVDATIKSKQWKEEVRYCFLCALSLYMFTYLSILNTQCYKYVLNILHWHQVNIILTIFILALCPNSWEFAIRSDSFNSAESTRDCYRNCKRHCQGIYIYLYIFIARDPVKVVIEKLKYRLPQRKFNILLQSMNCSHIWTFRLLPLLNNAEGNKIFIFKNHQIHYILHDIFIPHILVWLVFGTKASLSSTFRTAFENSLLPAFQAGTDRMFAQLQVQSNINNYYYLYYFYYRFYVITTTIPSTNIPSIIVFFQ